MSTLDQDVSIPVDAAGWYARHRSGPLTSGEAEAFTRWLEIGENRIAFERLGALWGALDDVGGHPEITRLREAAYLGDPGGYGHRALAAVLAVFAFVSLAGLGWLWLEHRAGQDNYQSAIGERSTVQLDDGSVVVLDTDSIVRVHLEKVQRTVRLVRGRAYFHVAKDPSRPFVVKAGAMTVTALGTQFDVDLRPRKTEIVLTEGAVRIEPKGLFDINEPVVLSPGQGLIAASGEDWKVKPVDGEVALAWLKGKLVFSPATIGVISEELNRYSDRKIIVDPRVADVSMSAVLEAKDRETFVRSVEAMGLARADIQSDGSIRLEPSPKKN